MATTDVKPGDRVIYCVAGREYPAVATSAPHFGVHAGWKWPSHHLNLTYLDDGGNAVRRGGVPLMTEAATEEQLDLYAVTAATAAHPPGHLRDGAKKLYRRQMVETPRTVGWKPAPAKEEQLLALLADPDVDLEQIGNEKLETAISHANARRARRGKPSEADLDAIAADEKARQEAAGETVRNVPQAPASLDASAAAGVAQAEAAGAATIIGEAQTGDGEAQTGDGEAETGAPTQATQPAATLAQFGTDPNVNTQPGSGSGSAQAQPETGSAT